MNHSLVCKWCKGEVMLNRCLPYCTLNAQHIRWSTSNSVIYGVTILTVNKETESWKGWLVQHELWQTVALKPHPAPTWLCCVLGHFSRVWLFAIPWTTACQAPLSMGFSRQKYWSGLPIPFPGDLPNLGIKPGSPALQAGSLLTESKVINIWWWLSC